MCRAAWALQVQEACSLLGVGDDLRALLDGLSSIRCTKSICTQVWFGCPAPGGHLHHLVLTPSCRPQRVFGQEELAVGALPAFAPLRESQDVLVQSSLFLYFLFVALDVAVQVLKLRPGRTGPCEDDDVGIGTVHIALRHLNSLGCRQVVAALDGDRLPSRPACRNRHRGDQHGPSTDLQDRELSLRAASAVVDMPCGVHLSDTLLNSVTVGGEGLLDVLDQMLPHALPNCDLLDIRALESVLVLGLVLLDAHELLVEVFELLLRQLRDCQDRMTATGLFQWQRGVACLDVESSRLVIHNHAQRLHRRRAEKWRAIPGDLSDVYLDQVAVEYQRVDERSCRSQNFASSELEALVHLADDWADSLFLQPVEHVPVPSGTGHAASTSRVQDDVLVLLSRVVHHLVSWDSDDDADEPRWSGLIPWLTADTLVTRGARPPDCELVDAAPHLWMLTDQPASRTEVTELDAVTRPPSRPSHWMTVAIDRPELEVQGPDLFQAMGQLFNVLELFFMSST